METATARSMPPKKSHGAVWSHRSSRRPPKPRRMSGTSTTYPNCHAKPSACQTAFDLGVVTIPRGLTDEPSVFQRCFIGSAIYRFEPFASTQRGNQSPATWFWVNSPDCQTGLLLPHELVRDNRNLSGKKLLYLFPAGMKVYFWVWIAFRVLKVHQRFENMVVIVGNGRVLPF